MEKKPEYNGETQVGRVLRETFSPNELQQILFTLSTLKDKVNSSITIEEILESLKTVLKK